MRECAYCGNTDGMIGKQSTARYCSQRCRKTDYHANHRAEEHTKNAVWRQTHAEWDRERHLIYQAANSERLRARGRAYAIEHRETRKAWTRAHPEQVAAYRAKAYAADPEKYRARYRAWSAANREKRAAYMAAYDKTHPEPNRNAANRRRALDLNAICRAHIACRVGNVRDLAVAIRDHECWMCGSVSAPGMIGGQAWPLDHIVPLKRGGTHCVDNVAWACKPCNSWKKDRLVEELYA